MEPSDLDYLHGTHPQEQTRLSRLNALINRSSLEALALREGDRVLDVGAGLGQLTRLMARQVGAGGRVLGIERNAEQLAEAVRQAGAEGEASLLELREGDAVNLPLEPDEWGSFDVAHARFLLEHVRVPLAVVRSMVRAVRPGGRVILEDDDHEMLRLSPAVPTVLELWRAYTLTYERQGRDPYIGRRLVSLLHEAGATPVANRCLFFGTCNGSPDFDLVLDNFIGIIQGTRSRIIELGLADDRLFDEGLQSFRRWRELPDAALWYTIAWAEARSGGAPAGR